MAGNPTSVDDPEVFLAIEDLELVGRALADAVWLGRHNGIRRGAGVEFHSHSPYRAGDDLRRLNWALFARQRRLYSKESHQESLRPVYLLIDATGSMGVTNGPWPKYRYAARIAAGLAWLAAGQGDAPALGVLQQSLAAATPPRTGSHHAAGLCALLAQTTPHGPGDISAALADARTLCRQRGFVVLLSDFFDKEALIMAELSHLRAHGHDVLALQVLDPLEAELPPDGDFKFLDAESGDHLEISASEIRAVHAKTVADWCASLRTAAHTAGVRWESVTTTDSIVPTLRRWMSGV